MATNEKDGQFVFSVLNSIVGDAEKYFGSTGTTAMVYAECLRNEELQSMARMYLYSGSEFAEALMTNLKAKLISTFGLVFSS